MKPSTYKKLEKIEKVFWETWYRLLYPLAWILYKIEKYNKKYIERRASPERVAKLLAKSIYKKLCKNKHDYEGCIHSADWTDSECGYRDFSDLIFLYTKSKSRARKYWYALPNKYDTEVQKELLALTMSAFAELNEYTYMETNYDSELAEKTYYVKGYERTYIFGIHEEVN